jgi:branched-chain amino acid transport system ATP-binding protein
MLNVENIDVFYGTLRILRRVSLEIKSKELVAIVGANGSGKSTLLKTISGLHRPSSGTIFFSGIRIDKLPPERIAKIGVIQVPEGRRVFPYLTVFENLLMGAYVNKEAWERRFDTLEWVYSLYPILKERKNQLAATLSGGEAQMLAIARGLMSRPKLLMLDEPSLGLAPKLVLELFGCIERLHEEGITILLVEQNVYQALKIADRGYVLSNGTIALEGKAEELLANDLIKSLYLGM